LSTIPEPVDSEAAVTGRQQSGRVWLVAFLLTLLLHAVVITLLVWTRPFQANPVRAQEPEPIRMVFAKPQPPASDDSESSLPKNFSELPPDRVDVAPEKADLLSNVDSRARDRVEGGNENSMPRLQGESEAPHVAMREADAGEAMAASEPAARGDPQAEDSRTSHASAQGGEDPLRPTDDLQPGTDTETRLQAGAEDGGDFPRREANTSPQDELVRNQGLAVPQLVRPQHGMQDIFQEEMHNPGGNAALFGDVSLNTLEWAYAPWLQRFRRDFVRNWVAPYAYYLGLINGWTLVELEIAKDGRLLRLDLLDQQGHESLSQQSIASFKATAPFRPLPKDFPEATLILRIKLIYPPLRRR